MICGSCPRARCGPSGFLGPLPFGCKVIEFWFIGFRVVGFRVFGFRVIGFRVSVFFFFFGGGLGFRI